MYATNERSPSATAEIESRRRPRRALLTLGYRREPGDRFRSAVSSSPAARLFGRSSASRVPAPEDAGDRFDPRA